jgi:glycosyltransferase involved in cell wall biosynthesis
VTRICILTQYLGLGGGEHAKLLSLLRFSELRGWSCDVYYPMEGPRPTRQEEELKTLSSVGELYPVRVHRRAPHFWRALEFARRCEFREGYDKYVLVATPLLLGLPFVHHGRGFTAWVASSLGEESRTIPKTRLRHYLLYNPITWLMAARLERACARRADLVIGVSRYTVSQLEREFGIPSRKLRVIPVPVDTDRFTPGTPVLNERPYILSVARLDRRKDLPTLLRAFHKVREVVNIELRIVGGGPERSRLEHTSRSIGLEKYVRFLGEVGRDELLEQYRGAALFVLSSRQEGLGIVLLEAMATGLAIVSTDSGGAADPVVSGETGFLVDVGDARALAEAVLRLLRDSAMALQMGRAGRERAVRQFSVSAVNGLLESALTEINGTPAAFEA